MQKDLRDKIRAATEASGAAVDTAAPIEAIFDSVTEALLSVGADGVIRNCNKVCTHYFKLTRDQLVGSNIANILRRSKKKSGRDKGWRQGAGDQWISYKNRHKYQEEGSNKGNNLIFS